MRRLAFLLVLSLAIVEECRQTVALKSSKSKSPTKGKTTAAPVTLKTTPKHTTAAKNVPVVHGKKVVLKPTSAKDTKPKPVKVIVHGKKVVSKRKQSTSKDGTQIKTRKSRKKSEIHVIKIQADTSALNKNNTHGSNTLTNVSYTKAEDNAPKDYTIVGEYKIFKYEDDHIKKDDCPPYWHKYDGNCYLFSRDRLNWYLASMKCFNLGGFLATVESSHENTYIINQLKAYKITRGAWMGLNTVLYPQKHKWYWGFSGKRNFGFDWYGFEPVYKKKGDYLCAIFWKTYHFHWHVGSCSQNNYYVCKIKLKESCSCTF
ncbi:C-type lectin domain family 7 member A-like [Saccostrea echinata]|uniref:C-type lectin domain family 7 member A-like n=1 Tax=Saccostrea echinata TaxID=191078 RepID=UPI002A828A4F|nr:C-type lectin domain family 7 member A-like [Saccostrea echinata]